MSLAETIIQKLKLARSFEEALEALHPADRMTVEEKEKLHGLLRTSFRDADQRPKKFTLIMIEPLGHGSGNQNYRIVARSPVPKPPSQT